MTDIKFGEEQMRAVVTKAIIEGLGEDQKLLVITQAVEHLMGAPTDERGYPHNQDKRNRIQRAFDVAAEQALMKFAHEEMAKPENLARIRALMGPIIEQVLGDPMAYNVQRAVGEAITQVLRKNQ